MLEVCKGLLAQFGVRPEQYQIGRSKLFFRAGVLGQLEDSATRINKCARPMHACFGESHGARDLFGLSAVQHLSSLSKACHRMRQKACALHLLYAHACMRSLLRSGQLEASKSRCGCMRQRPLRV